MSKQQSKALEGIGIAGGVAFAAVAAAITLATIEAAKFEEQIVNLKAVTGASADEIAKASTAAQEFGPAMGIAADQTAIAMQEFAKAGYDLSRLSNGEMKDALELMVAGELAAGDAAAYAANSVSIYRKENLSLKQIADIAVGAANASATSVKEMSDANRQLGNVGATVGLTFEDVNTTLAIFAQNGLRGSDGATSLKTALIQLAAPTDEQKRVMTDLNLAFFDATGKMKPMAEVADMLRDRLSKYNAQAQTTILSTLAGTDGVRALTTLMASSSSEFVKMRQEMSKVTAAENAATRMESLNAQLRVMQAEAGVAGQKFADSLMPAIKGVVAEINDLIGAYNALSPAQQGAITNATLTVGVMGGTLAVLAAVTIGLGKMRAAAQAAGGALAILQRHPVVFALTALVGILTSVALAHQQAKEAAEAQAAAQDKLNASISNAKSTSNAGDYKNLLDEQRTIEDLGKTYEELWEMKKKLEADSKLRDGVDIRSIHAAKDELNKLNDTLDAHIVKMGEAGITVENYSKKAEEYRTALVSNVDMLLKVTQEERASLTEAQNKINTLKRAAEEYDNLTDKESLNADEKARLSEVVKTLTSLVPGLNSVNHESGEVTISNTSLIYDMITALAAQKSQSEATTTALLNDSYKTAESIRVLWEAQLKSIMAAQAAREALVQDTGQDHYAPDNFEWREQEQVKTLKGKLAGKNVSQAALQKALDEISSGVPVNIPSTGAGSGGLGYEVPDVPKKAKKADDPDDETRKAYQARLAMIEHEAEQGITVGGDYVAALKSLQSDYTDFLSRNYQERFAMQSSLDAAIEKHWQDSIDLRVTAMEREQKSAIEIAQYEVQAYQDAMNVAGLSAAKRLEFEAKFYAAKLELQSADFDNSQRWIDENDKAMERAGKSEIERLNAQVAAYERMNSRRGTGRYTLEQEREIADSLADSYYRMSQALDEAAQSAIDLQEKMAMDALEDDFERETDAIERQIDALEEKTALEDYSLKIAREQEKLAELKANRDKVAADKRFEYITRDKDGNLVAKRVADQARLDELDKQIADQKRSIDEMKRQEEIRLQREHLQKQLEQERQNYEKRKAQTTAFYEWMRKETTDKLAAVAKGEAALLAERYAQVMDFVTKTKKAYESLNATIGGFKGVPSGGAIGGAVGGVIPAVGGAVGGVIGKVLDTVFKSLPKRHGGGPIEGRPGEEVPIMGLAGEYVLSLDHLRQASRLDQQMRALMSSYRTMPSMSAMQSAMSGGGPRGGGVVIDTGGAPLVGQIVSNASDTRQVAQDVKREVFDELDRIFWKSTR